MQLPADKKERALIPHARGQHMMETVLLAIARPSMAALMLVSAAGADAGVSSRVASKSETARALLKAARRVRVGMLSRWAKTTGVTISTDKPEEHDTEPARVALLACSVRLRAMVETPAGSHSGSSDELQAAAREFDALGYRSNCPEGYRQLAAKEAAR